MTIVVTYARYPIVLQVTDRRLTWPDGSIADDDTTKSILWNRSFLISYTGLARIQGKPTYQWIAHLLAQHSQQLREGYLDRKLAILGGAIAEALAAERIRSDCKRLAIIGAGWGVPWDATEPPPAGLRTYVWYLSNFLDKDGKSTNDVRRTVDSGIVTGRPLKVTEMALFTHGQAMERPLWSQLRRLLRKAAMRTASPAAPARLIQDAVRRMNNQLVGKSLLLCSLPVPSVPPSPFLVNEGPNLTRPSFWQTQADGEWRVQHGPIVVTGANIAELIETRHGYAVNWPRKPTQ